MEHSRRIFIRNTAITSLGLALIPGCTPASRPAVGLQLYTVRNQMTADALGTLQTIAKIGYTQIETAGYSEGKIYGMSASEFKTVLSDLGLEFVSGHMGLNVFRDGFDQALDFMAEAGQKYAILPWFMPEDRATLDQYRSYAALLNTCGEKAKSRGIMVGYHNHDFEFVPIDGVLPMDILLKETDPSLVCMELDLYWISKVNLDPIAFFDQNKGRVLLWHVKDMDATAEGNFTEVGNGVIDYSEIFKNKEKSGMKYFFVEQDQSADPLKSIEISYKNLTEKILV